MTEPTTLPTTTASDTPDTPAAHRQAKYQVRFDWAADGARAVAGDADIVIWVDTLGDGAIAAAAPDLAAAAAAGRAVGEPGDEGEAEGDGLAGAGLAASEDVAARQGVGQGVGLDGERLGLAVGRENGDERSGHAEIGEGRGGHWCLSGIRPRRGFFGRTGRNGEGAGCTFRSP